MSDIIEISKVDRPKIAQSCITMTKLMNKIGNIVAVLILLFIRLKKQDFLFTFVVVMSYILFVFEL